MSSEWRDHSNQVRSFVRRQQRRAAAAAGVSVLAFLLLLICVHWRLAPLGSPFLAALAIIVVSGAAYAVIALGSTGRIRS